jgi:putative phosphoribosyl transferase
MSTSSESLEEVRLARLQSSGGHFDAELILPSDPAGIIVLAHGSGSSRLSPRNRFVARILRSRRFGTLLIDLETNDEGNIYGDSLANIGEMACRVNDAALWLAAQPELAGLRIGYLGAGTGAAACLTAASSRPDLAGAIVCRGGRLELAHSVLEKVEVPTLLIVGARDVDVIHQHRASIDLLPGKKHLEVIPGAEHLFKEPGTLAAAAFHATNWFATHLVQGEPLDGSEVRNHADRAVVQMDG